MRYERLGMATSEDSHKSSRRYWSNLRLISKMNRWLLWIRGRVLARQLLPTLGRI